jgi:hypothetical protein
MLRKRTKTTGKCSGNSMFKIGIAKIMYARDISEGNWSVRLG